MHVYDICWLNGSLPCETLEELCHGHVIKLIRTVEDYALNGKGLGQILEMPHRHISIYQHECHKIQYKKYKYCTETNYTNTNIANTYVIKTNVLERNVTVKKGKQW